MKKYLLIIIMMSFVLDLQAETMDAHYKVSFGMIGEIGEAKAHLEKEANKYSIEVAGEATGLAKNLSKNRKEIQMSKGHIKEGLLIPDSYTVIRSFSNKVITNTYTIDHEKKSVVQFNEKTENGKRIWSDRKVLNYYADNDLLTLYFNINILIPEKGKKGLYAFKIVGAEKQKGNVEIIVPDKDNRGEYEKNLGGKGTWYLTAIIHQKIFSSNKGELILSINETGITEKAMLKDVVMFGDIVSERVK